MIIKACNNDTGTIQELRDQNAAVNSMAAQLKRLGAKTSMAVNFYKRVLIGQRITIGNKTYIMK